MLKMSKLGAPSLPWEGDGLLCAVFCYLQYSQ